MDQLKDELKEIRKDVKELLLQSTKNTQSLAEHMRRTDANESRITRVETWMLGLLASILLAIIAKLGSSAI